MPKKIAEKKQKKIANRVNGSAQSSKKAVAKKTAKPAADKKIKKTERTKKIESVKKGKGVEAAKTLKKAKTAKSLKKPATVKKAVKKTQKANAIKKNVTVEKNDRIEKVKNTKQVENTQKIKNIKVDAQKKEAASKIDKTEKNQKAQKAQKNQKAQSIQLNQKTEKKQDKPNNQSKQKNKFEKENNAHFTKKRKKSKKLKHGRKAKSNNNHYHSDQRTKNASSSLPKTDPYFAREAQTYEFPVPSREFILACLRERKKPASFQQLVDAFSLKHEQELDGLKRRLSAMLRDGQLVLNRSDRYGLVDRMSLIAGFVQAHRDGFGWLIPEAGGQDIFLHAKQMRQVFGEDRVLVRVISKSGRRPEGAIVEVLERNTTHVAGRFYVENGIAFVDPDRKSIIHEIIVPAGSENNAQPGQFVVVKIIAQPSTRRQPMGEVVEVLGDHLTPGLEVELAIRAHSLPNQFPSAVLSEAMTLPHSVAESDCENRLDLRAYPFVTIDGEDAKDFDDAIYCEPLSNGRWRAMIAIADVAHYVTPDSALDVEAKLRGNSVYFPSRVIPMLPERLSNELCSLRPHCDRLTMVCDIELNADAEVISYRFDNAVIHSKARLTYTKVAAILEGAPAEDASLVPHLKNAHQLFKRLLLQRKLRGAIEFETTETQILFDKVGKIDRIVPRKRNVAHQIIEEFMLLANETTAKHLEKSGLPILYRVHDLPSPDKLLSLRDFLKSFSLRLGGGENPTSEDYAKLLDRVSKRPDAHLIQTVMLRSLRQAIYSTDNRGHFGLAYESYAHFTSPIRRYPDLLIHRALKIGIASKKKIKSMIDPEKMELIGEHCSMTERRADRASRDATDWLKCDYLKDKVGQVFDGFIVDVTGFGLFVELKDIYVQGLVHVTTLKNDYYQFDSVHHLLRGRSGNAVYRLGDPVRVLVARVNVDDRQIDFVME